MGGSMPPMPPADYHHGSMPPMDNHYHDSMPPMDYHYHGSMPPMDYHYHGSMGAAGSMYTPYTAAGAAGSMPPVVALVEERTFSASSNLLVAASVSGLIALVALTAVYNSKNRRSTYTRLESVV